MKPKTKSKHRWSRKEWVANRADPTQVVQWTRKCHFGISVTLLESWGLETKIRIKGHEYRSYDNKFFLWLFSKLEEQHQNSLDSELSEYEFIERHTYV